jgi:hypothetical protein
MNATNSSSIVQSGNNLLIQNITNSNSVQLRTNTAGGTVRQNILCRNGNETVISGGATGIVRVVNSACTIECNTFSSDAPFNCNYNTLGTVPTKTSYDIGYIWQIAGSTFPNWTTFTTTQNIATMVFNGTGNYTKGVWNVDIVLCTDNTNPPNSRLIWTTVSSTSNAITKYCTYESGSTLFALQGVQIMRLSFILNVSSTPLTYYLNYERTTGIGSGLVENKTNSHIEFTRIA